jgi:ferredoxin/coenzyme F420-reducing hydrogenase delta subunit
VHRLATPQVRPARQVAIGLLVALLALAWSRPAPLHAPADPSSVGGPLWFDWLLLPALPLGTAAPVATWGGLAAATMLLLVLPWTARSARASVALVDTARCNGCGRCFDDCPYDAVTMVTRRDGRAFAVQASVDPDLCASCGICAGACPSASPFRSVERLDSGIDLPDRSVDDLRRRTDAVLAASVEPPVLVYACEHGADARSAAGPGVVVLPLSCAGQLPPAFVDYASRRGADGVVVAGCSERGCEFRLGARWTRERLAGLREPRLRGAARSERLLHVRADRGEERILDDRVREFVAAMRAHRVAASAPGACDGPRPARRGGEGG